ncbi:hypothetical protein E0Z10_g1167 [Xylaria hypoxylon]|uniref:Uncharacterized protein n=1 Tax=Xylaria hypoxylon TaxID=37992 RepID=A0A4Z0ZDA8_9PEZI|nr:hypothetical protein E0Z10_g1167 [Xylaria hypoxylon]
MDRLSIATEMPDVLKPFDKKELEYVAQTLSSEAANPKDVLQGCTVYDPINLWRWEGFELWVGGSKHFKTLTAPKGSGKDVTGYIWALSKIENTIKGMSPIFIFLTVPNSITDPKGALRCLLCTLICEISEHVISVPPEKMAESGIFGGQFVRKYIQRNYHLQDGQQSNAGGDGGNDDEIESLIELLNALQHCEFEATYTEETYSGNKRVKYVYIVVVDGIMKALEDAGPNYWVNLYEALQNTLWSKMNGYTLFIEEKHDA